METSIETIKDKVQKILDGLILSKKEVDEEDHKKRLAKQEKLKADTKAFFTKYGVAITLPIVAVGLYLVLRKK